MIDLLKIVNECLGTMGTVPLSTLNEPHAFKGSALRSYERADDTVQDKGWWYNTEELMLTPSPDTGHVYVPGDVIRIQSGYVPIGTSSPGRHQGRYVLRGRRLYDLQEGTYLITEELRFRVYRKLPLNEVPLTIQRLIMAEAVFHFQSNYDGDNNRRVELERELKAAWVAANSEQTRQLRVNRIDLNPSLQRIKRVTSRMRYSRR